ncbi:MAG: LacI family DNA-binding transcriptional regulator [Aristaeellaceae bacterium]
MPRKNVTIYDIAREAGVSPATVSRILTDSTSVSKDKRDRVNALIQKYNYRPNAMARALTETRSRVIGMVLADISNPYYNSIFTACTNEAFARGYMTMLFNTMSRSDMEQSALTRLLEQRVDAIIICGGRIDLTEPDPDFLQLLETTLSTTPVVVGSRSLDERICGVAVDHESSVDLAMDYLIGLGHRDIGFIYTGQQYYGTQQRLAHFRQKMMQAGLPVREEWLIPVRWYDFESGKQGIRRLMQLEKLPTALLGMNDLVSVGMLQELLAQGVRVPEDISLVGFDNTFITAITTPKLTTIHYDYGEYARLLVDAAIASIEGRRLPRNQLLRSELAIQGSCMPPV